MTGCIFARLLALLTSKEPIILMFMFMAAFVGLLPVQLEAQSATTPATKEALANGTPQRSIRELLGLDGTLNLNSGYKGSLDVQGYKMVSSPVEPPRFAVEAAAGDERWAGNFRPVGMNDVVGTLAVDGRGNLYAGGDFITAGGVTVNHIAKWDGSKWSPLGPGMNGPVCSLVIDGNGNLYAGGRFTTAGGVPANCIAKWNGIEWVALGKGVAQQPDYDDVRFKVVSALAVDGNGSLYAGGEFTIAGGVTVNNIAKWDGTTWSALGSGLSGSVRALAFDQNGNLYAGGSFTSAGGVAANNTARWNGINWSGISTGTNGIVMSIAIDLTGDVYVGGHFTTAGGVAANNIAKWNGITWSPLGSGISCDEFDYIFAIALDGFGNLFVGGRFTSAALVTANNVVKWNGSEWSSLGPGILYDSFRGGVAALSIDRSGCLYAGGRFTTAGGIAVSNFAKWNAGGWTAVGGSGITNNEETNVRSIAADVGGNIYAAGSFNIAGEAVAKNIAKWNGTEWSSVGSGMEGGVCALAVDRDGSLYAAGWISSAGGTVVNNIAKWNGSQWSALGEGINNDIYALAMDGSGNLYAGGYFTMAGGIPANHIAKWNGSEWSALGEGTNNIIYALAVDGSGNLYAGGDFSTAGGIPASYIAKWNGNEWSPLGEGTHACIRALALDGIGNLYTASFFSTKAGGDIAKWNGTDWIDIGQGINGSINALAIDEGGNLYVAGDFTRTGGVAAKRIAKWNGTVWSALGSGVNDSIYALAADLYGNIYAGGSFSMAGGKPSSRVAQWMGRSALAVDFPSEGLQLWDGSRKKISSQRPSVLATWGDRLVASFPELGLYLHDGSSWNKLSSLKSTESALGIADSLYVDAGARGVYRYKGGWKKIHTSNPTMMASCGEKLVANFPDIGIWTYDGSEWKKISSWTTAEQMVGIQQRLFVDFGVKGIYRYDGSWVRTTKNNPKLMHAFGTTLVASIDSASARGIFLYQNNSWKKISSAPSAESFASTPFTLYVDRGAQGIAKYEKKSWKEISSQNPDGIAIYGGKLVASLPDKGLYLYSNPGWSILSTSKDAGKMQGVLFE
ncbi:MAG: hypothetical protein AB9866_02345 [Syntrophobacteraceae bacterium]